MIKDIQCGSSHTLALTSAGEVYFSGPTLWGESGIPNSDRRKIDTFTKVPVPGEKEVIQICSGIGSFNLLVCADSTLLGTGCNDKGQLGLDAKRATCEVYNPIEGLPSPVKQISCGLNHTLAVLDDGSLWVTGCDEEGQLGLGSSHNQYGFVQVKDLPVGKDIVTIKAVVDGSFLVFDDGSLWAAGKNEDYRLGLPDSRNYRNFTSVAVGLLGCPVVKIASGLTSTLVLLDDGILMGVGLNLNGELGLGHTEPVQTLTKIDTLPPDRVIRTISAGDFFFTMALDDGSIWSAGDNTFHQLGHQEIVIPGIDDALPFTQAEMPNEMKGAILTVSTGGSFTMVLFDNGQVWGVGHNQMGSLGLPHKNVEVFTHIPPCADMHDVARPSSKALKLSDAADAAGAAAADSSSAPIAAGGIWSRSAARRDQADGGGGLKHKKNEGSSRVGLKKK